MCLVFLAQSLCRLILILLKISAGASFDWLLIDDEHAPNDLRSTVTQLQVIAANSLFERVIVSEAAGLRDPDRATYYLAMYGYQSNV